MAVHSLGKIVKEIRCVQGGVVDVNLNPLSGASAFITDFQERLQ